MSGRPDESLQELTGSLAELLAGENGTLVLAQLQKLALLANPPDTPEVPDRSLRVGIWQAELTDEGTADFVRSVAHEGEWRYWADTERIAPKAGPRVVLLGESVARGYLHDPCVTPASMLTAMLGDVEVVDLARTDLGLDGLSSLLDGVPALEPDAIVLFAGNNWHSLVFALGELEGVATAIRRDGFAGCRRVYAEELVASRARAVLDALAASVRDFGIPVVVVVPEFNLLDWRGEPAVLAPVLPDGLNDPWMRARDGALEALGAGRPQEAAREAERMVQLDRGTSSVGPTVLGELALGAGRMAEARRHFEGARDAVFGLLVAHSPRCPAGVQAILREKAAEHGFELVDLPRIVEAELGGGLPGRELFLDYCHLTLEGMRIAVSAIAERLLPLLSRPEVPASVLRSTRLETRPQDEAMTHLLAAVHNAHYGQRFEILLHHCARAIELWPGVSESMLALLDSQCRFAEHWLCDSFDRLCDSPIVRRYLSPVGTRPEKLADFQLSEALVTALERAGADARERAVELLIAEHAGEPGGVDLLSSRYRAATFRDRGGYSLGPERAYYRALDLTSSFYLIRGRAGPVALELTCRLPTGKGEVGVRANGEPVGTFAAGGSWMTSALELPARRGLNHIELEWPLQALRWKEELERAARRVERGVYPDVLPAFGEVHAFTAR